MQEIIIEIILTFCVSAMTFSVKRGGSEPMHDLRISMGFQNHFNERAKLSRRITIEQKIKRLPASHLRALLRQLNEDRGKNRIKDRTEDRTEDRAEDRTGMDDFTTTRGNEITKSRRKTTKSWRRLRKNVVSGSGSP